MAVRDDFTAGEVLAAADLNDTFASKGDITTNGAWSSYTPTWTNLTVGNGTVTAAYLQLGKLVHVRIRLVFGSTSSISGDVAVTLPINRVAGSTPYLNTVQFLDPGVAIITGTTNISTAVGLDKIVIRYINAASGTTNAGALSTTLPFTWTTNDEILVAVAYEGA